MSGVADELPCSLLCLFVDRLTTPGNESPARDEAAVAHRPTPTVEGLREQFSHLYGT
jgi:hypothetical protein